MRVLLDANVLIPGLVVPGMCWKIVEHCLDRHEVVLSDHLLAEVRRNLLGKMKLSARRTDVLLDSLRAAAVVVEPEAVCRDPKDLPVLGTATAGDARCLVTGDQDLLELGSFRGLVILGPAFSRAPAEPDASCPADFWGFEAKGE